MKKIIIILLLFISTFVISCYDTSNSNYIELKDVAIFDEEGNQIMGNIWQDYKLDEVVSGFYMSSKGDKNANIKKMNSAAPVSYIYTIDANLHESYTVNMKFTSKGSKKLAGIKLSNSLYSEHNTYPLEYIITEPTEEDETTTVSFKIDALTANNNFYSLSGYTLIEKGKEVDYHYTVKGGSRHFKGICFNLGEYNHLDQEIVTFNRNFNSTLKLAQDVTNFDFSKYNIEEVEGKKIIRSKEESEYNVFYTAEYITIKDKQILIITSINFNDPSIKIYNGGVNDDISVFDHPLRYYSYECHKEGYTRTYTKERICIIVQTTDVVVRSVEVRLN